MLNKVTVIGRLTRDPELRYTQNGTAVATFTLAVDRNYTNGNGERETDFLRIVVWRKLAEACANNLNKGRQVAVEGRIQNRPYQDQNGQKRFITEIVAESVYFLEGKKNNNSNNGKETTYAPTGTDDSPFPF